MTALLFLAVAALNIASAGHYENGVYIPDTRCADPNNCGGSSTAAPSQGSAMGNIIGQAVGAAIGNALRPKPRAAPAVPAAPKPERIDPEQERLAEKEAAERAAAQAEVEAKAHERLTGSLMGVGPAPELRLMGGGDAHELKAGSKAAVDQKAVAGKQAQALQCAVEALVGLTGGDEAGSAALGSDLKGFMADVRKELAAPCSGRPGSHKIQTLSLSSLAEGRKIGGGLAASVLVSRDEGTCEVHLQVQYESSRKDGRPSGEGQSIIHIDKSGRILAMESPKGVEDCLARESRRIGR